MRKEFTVVGKYCRERYFENFLIFRLVLFSPSFPFFFFPSFFFFLDSSSLFPRILFFLPLRTARLWPADNLRPRNRSDFLHLLLLFKPIPTTYQESSCRRINHDRNTTRKIAKTTRLWIVAGADFGQIGQNNPLSFEALLTTKP